MNSVEQVIILAAGKSLQLDGVNKALICHPITKKSILEYAVEAFSGKKIIVVVGFRAIQIMQKFPQLDYVLNPDWALTNNAMSLALALNDKPTYVISGDIFIDKKLIERLDKASPDLALVSNRENRILSAIHFVVNSDNKICETYQGPIKDIKHPESLGIFKISNPEILRSWKKRSLEHSNLFAGQLLPCKEQSISVEYLNDEFFYEINTPIDYLELTKQVYKK
ncbi:NTP transferase domain-containing protein [Aliarcobacter cryaerophilus]|uniref:NTP transferase domain-containing protein n=1 Tax=Aliarcobacter cryaerophilus TaxID=28198 RepID=UPI003DA36BC9